MNWNKLAIGAGGVIATILIFKFIGFLFKYAMVILIGGLAYMIYHEKIKK